MPDSRNIPADGEGSTAPDPQTRRWLTPGRVARHLALPWLGLLFVILYPPRTSDAELIQAIVIPIVLCLVRAGFLAHRVPDVPPGPLGRGVRWRFAGYQLLFALSLLVLMAMEVIGVMAVSAGEREVWIAVASCYLIYAALAIGAEACYGAGDRRLDLLLIAEAEADDAL